MNIKDHELPLLICLCDVTILFEWNPCEQIMNFIVVDIYCTISNTNQLFISEIHISSFIITISFQHWKRYTFISPYLLYANIFAALKDLKFVPGQ